MSRSIPPWNPAESAAANARRILPRMISEYFEAGRRLDHNSGAKAMHRFRLKTKHLRYTLEAFVPLYGPGLQRRVDGLRPIQNALGDLNDCEVLLEQMRDRLPAQVRTFVAHRAGEKRKEFLRYWREEFDAAEEDRKWARYLTRFVRTNS